MITAQQLFNQAMDLMDKRSATGSIEASKVSRYLVRTPNILTMFQSELAKTGDLFATFEFDNKPIPNMLGLLSNFELTEFTSEDLTYEANGQCRAYYFEVDSEATVYIEDYTTDWNILATINVPSTITSLTSYKGLITPTEGSTKSRIRFSGVYYYKTLNRALFEYSFQADKIPDYRPWIKKTMPDDFKSLDMIISEYPQRQYEKDTLYKWEGKKDLYINYYFEGNYRAIYKPVPIAITSLTQSMQIDDITSMAGAYYLASHLLLTEDVAVASFFNDRFLELKIESNIRQPATIEQIIDVYSLGSD